MKKKSLVILTAVCLCSVMGMEACSKKDDTRLEEQEEAERMEQEEPEQEEWQEQEEQIQAEPEATQTPAVNLSYNISEDVEKGLLYATADGKLSDQYGNIASGYSYLGVTDNGYLFDKEGEFALEGYYVGDGGQIFYRELEPVAQYSGIEELRSYASWANCTTNIINGSYFTRFDDDGDYFDEVILGAWFDENGSPKAEMLPEGLSTAFDFAQVHYLRFIDSENWTIDEIKRSSADDRTIYAFVLKNITKRGDAGTDVNLVGREFTSGEELVVHGRFDKILNGDTLLVFGHFNGLASDDTPNFQGGYIQIINNKLN